jgi:transcription initiation factor TFIIB
MTGVHPAGFAAACLYTAGQEVGQWLTQAEAAAMASYGKDDSDASRDGS